MDKSTKNSIPLPPIWCSNICRNAMNEVCIEHCAIKRDCSGFEEKPNLKLIDMPRFPNTQSMTSAEKYFSVAIYLAKVIDHLQGFEDEQHALVVHPPIERRAIEKTKPITDMATATKGALVDNAKENE